MSLTRDVALEAQVTAAKTAVRVSSETLSIT
jgi:hypothetical protein